MRRRNSCPDEVRYRVVHPALLESPRGDESRRRDSDENLANIQTEGSFPKTPKT
jgi:hypothetical protein